MTTPDRYTLLKEFVAKAGDVQSQRKAHSLWVRLVKHLDEDERRRLAGAWVKHKNGSGIGELESVSDNIVIVWKAIDGMANNICADEDARILERLRDAQ